MGRHPNSVGTEPVKLSPSREVCEHLDRLKDAAVAKQLVWEKLREITLPGWSDRRSRRKIATVTADLATMEILG